MHICPLSPPPPSSQRTEQSCMENLMEGGEVNPPACHSTCKKHSSGVDGALWKSRPKKSPHGKHGRGGRTIPHRFPGFRFSPRHLSPRHHASTQPCQSSLAGGGGSTPPLGDTPTPPPKAVSPHIKPTHHKIARLKCRDGPLLASRSPSGGWRWPRR